MKSTHIVEIQPERDVSGSNFTKGLINYNFTLSSTGYVNMYRSFIKLRFSATDKDGNVLEKADNETVTMNLFSNLFQSMRMHINSTTVSEIGDYCAAVASLGDRMHVSEERTNNYLAPTNFNQAFFEERQAEVVSDPANVVNSGGGNRINSINNVLIPRNKGKFELIAHVPLGIFQVDEFIPGCNALFNLQLTPQPESVLQLAAFEIDPTNDLPADTKAKFTVESMNLYIMKGIGPPVTSKSITLDLTEIRCQSQNLTTASLHQKTFQVRKGAFGITTALQAPGASILNQRRIASKFRGQAAQGVDTGEATSDKNIVRMWVDYCGKQLPTPIPDMQLTETAGTTPGTDFYTQRYVETLMYTNSLNSPEPYYKWLHRGPYYHFSGYPQDNEDDRVYVSIQLTPETVNLPNLLLFDHYTRKVMLSIENSRITNVKSM